jgi:uncharacterized protein YndB with AHSA1/START domain
VAEREPIATEPGGTAADDVVREIRIAAPPGDVFEFFTDRKQMVRWMGQEAEIEPHPGGIYRASIDGNIMRGEFLEVERPHRVVFTWGWEGGGPVPPGSSTVVVELRPDGDGTLVRLTHRDLPAEMRPIHGDGWDRFLQRLAVAATGGDPNA